MPCLYKGLYNKLGQYPKKGPIVGIDLKPGSENFH